MENKLQSKQGDTISSEIIDRKPIGDLLLIQRMVEKAADMVFLLGPMGRIQYANEAACKALGYTLKELQSMTVFDLNQKHHSRNWEEHEAKLKKLGSMTFENVLKAKDNRLIPVEICANYVRLGDKEYNYSFTRDITERKQTERELEKYRKHLEDLVNERTRKLENVNNQLQADIAQRKQTEQALVRERYILMKSQEVARLGNWAYYLETGELTGSAANYRIYGFNPGEVKPDLKWFLSRVLPEERAAVVNFIEARAKDGTSGSIDYRIGMPDGSIRYVNTIVDKAVKNKAGIVKRLYGISQDITERKLAEEALVKAKQLSELYLDLMGHDINNMHQVALGYLELAEEYLSHEDIQREYLEKPREVLQRSAQLIQNVRKLQKIHEGVFQEQDIDVCNLLVEAISEYEPMLDKPIQLNLNGHERCLVRANELLYDVFSNLVGNAVKHAGNRAEIALYLDIIKDNSRKYCRVAVEDNGPGIPEENKKGIFNRMHKGSARGMGIGLYLVKSLVDSYGGSVCVEDRVPGEHMKGARFVVMLPAVEK